jgi:hypothetical protein
MELIHTTSVDGPFVGSSHGLLDSVSDNRVGDALGSSGEGNAQGVLEMVEAGSSSEPRFISSPRSIRTLAASCAFLLQATASS